MMPLHTTIRVSATGFSVLLLSCCVLGQRTNAQPNTSATMEIEMQIPASEPWTDTGLELTPSDTIEFRAVQGGSGSCDTEGIQLAAAQQRDLPLRQINPGALIAKFASGYAEPLAVGREARVTIANPGRLFLGANTDGDTFCHGYFYVMTKFTFAPDTQSEKPVLQQLLDRLPRRVTDAQGDPGDMVNLAFLGESSALLQALADAKWVLVDRAKTAAAINAIMATYAHENYLEMPMSNLYLLGRAQDYGFAMAQAYKVVASRHHFRVWKTPFLIDDAPLWLGSGTHDIGFEKDRRTGHLTHKIDPAIDQERDFIRDSLVAARLSLVPTYDVPESPFTSGTNATGGSMFSDGRIVVLDIRTRDRASLGSR